MKIVKVLLNVLLFIQLLFVTLHQQNQFIMSTVKVIFDEKRLTKSGEVPIWLRIIKDRKPKYISLRIKVKPKDWDVANNRVKKSHPNSQRLNNFISHKLADAEGIVLELDTSKKYSSPSKVKDAVLGRSSVSFFKYAQRNLDRLEKEGKVSTFESQQITLIKLKKYLKGKDLIFDELTVPFLIGYQDYLRDELGNAVNTIHCNFKNIRKLVNDAVREEILPMDKNPFIRFKCKSENSEKSFLTEEELQKVEEIYLDPEKNLCHSRNMYVFACYTGGLRISDMLQLKWGNYDGERLIIRTQKTDTLLSIMLPNKSKAIIEQYLKTDTQPTDFIFPFLENYKDYSEPFVLHKSISNANATINIHLSKIATALQIPKKMNFHSSRHCFAVRALRKGMRIEYVSKLMAHSSIKTTQIYAKIVNEQLDEAMAIFNL